jgi:hypothetical protein
MKSFHAYMMAIAMFGAGMYNNFCHNDFKSSSNAYPKRKGKLQKDIRSYHKKAYTSNYKVS